MKHIASCSFGKDSLAAIIVCEEHGIHIDEAIYCRVMFDENISAEYPEHEEFIYNTAIPLLKERYGIPTTIAQSPKTYCSQFYQPRMRGNNIGKIYGFPIRLGPWCNSKLKISPIKSYLKSIKEEYREIVGIAVDEIRRIDRQLKAGKFLPLVEYNITENEAWEICKRHGLLSPAYEFDGGGGINA